MCLKHLSAILLTCLFIITFPAFATAAELVVEVVDSAGSPITGATVSTEAKGYSRQARTDDGGFAFFNKVPPRTLSVSIEADGFSSGYTVVEMHQSHSAQTTVTLMKLVGLEELIQM